MRPFNSALIAAALLAVAAPSFAQYRPSPPRSLPGNDPSTYPTANPSNNPMANGQHPLWGIVGEVVRTIVERTVPQPNTPQQPGGGTNPQATPHPQGTGTPAPQSAPQPRINPQYQPRTAGAAPRPCVGCDAGPRS